MIIWVRKKLHFNKLSFWCLVLFVFQCPCVHGENDSLDKVDDVDDVGDVDDVDNLNDIDVVEERYWHSLQQQQVECSGCKN